MNLKAIFILAIFLVFTVPLLIKATFYAAVSTANPSTENIEKGAELIAEAATLGGSSLSNG